MLSYYYIVCRSLTYAQRTETALKKDGIRGSVLRTPKTISTSGCSYAVRIPENQLSRALARMNQEGLSPVRIFLGEADGEFREVDP